MLSDTDNSQTATHRGSLRICAISTFILVTYGVVQVLSDMTATADIALHSDIQRALISKDSYNPNDIGSNSHSAETILDERASAQQSQPRESRLNALSHPIDIQKALEKYTSIPRRKSKGKRRKNKHVVDNINDKEAAVNDGGIDLQNMNLMEIYKAIQDAKAMAKDSGNSSHGFAHYVKKSKFVGQCPADFEQLVERDRILNSGVFTPSEYTNYASLKQHFWSDVIARQESQWDHPDTLRQIQTDTIVLEGEKPHLPLGNVDGLQQNGCAYNGKVFGVGMYKSGTSSLALALADLGYIDNHATSRYHRLHPYYCGYSHWYLTLRHYYDYINSVANINNNQILDQLLRKSQRSFMFADSPMFLFWPFFDQWYPGSKYILTVRGSPAKFANSLMKFCLQLQECMTWIFYPDLGGKQSSSHSLRHGKQEEYRQWKKGKMIRRTDIGLSREEVEVYNWSSVSLRDFRMSYYDEIDGEQLAHYIAMIYELHTQRIIDYFRKHNRMDDLLILNADEMSNDEKWTALTKFLGCSNHEVLDTKSYPHANPTKSVFKSIHLVPDEFDLNWKRYFNGTIPMMMTEHAPVRKVWFEYQHLDKYGDDYDVLI